MSSIAAFEELVSILTAEPKVSFFVEAEVLQDMGVNHKHLAETAERTIVRKNLIKKGSDGQPVSVVEFEFRPRDGVN